MSGAPEEAWIAPSSIRGLIFDCDGTLADTMPAHFVAWTTMLAEHGIAFSERRFYELGGMPTDRIIDLVAAESGVPVVDVASMVAHKEGLYLDSVTAVRPIDVVCEIATRYQGRLPMAVASGGQRTVVRRTLEVIGIAELFDTVVCSEDTTRHKPEPDVFLEAARRLAVEAEACVVFEDTDLGLEAARRAGMIGVDIRPWLAGR